MKVQDKQTKMMSSPSDASSRPFEVNRTMGIYYSSYELEQFVSDFSRFNNSIEDERHLQCTTSFFTTDPSRSNKNVGHNLVDEENRSYIGSPKSVVIDDNTEQKLSNPYGIIKKSKGNDDSIAKHRSKRQKKTKKVKQEQKRTYYDMNIVPNLQKNKIFLKRWHQKANNKIRPLQNPSASLSLTPLQTLNVQQSCLCLDKENSFNPNLEEINNQLPFRDDSSVVWVPRSRSEWEDCIDEMTAICTTAAWHRHQQTRCEKEFRPPLSRVYIRDRIDIDDPLRGYQIRHKNGWLQGFVMMTTFTTWTHYFMWDSNHEKNGILPIGVEVGLVDDGTLSNELQQAPRSGDPTTKGVVWPSVAEIGLVGALGCGEYLVKMALDDIWKRGSYDFVVLQATETARPFYEKHGFVRVGAVSKYGSEKDVAGVTNSVDEVGYRHWTYANETDERLTQHGAPSIMMALKLRDQRVNEQIACSDRNLFKSTSILQELTTLFVSCKPKIEHLGLTSKKTKFGNRVISSSSIRRGKIKLAKVTKDEKIIPISSNIKKQQDFTTPTQSSDCFQKERSDLNIVTPCHHIKLAPCTIALNAQTTIYQPDCLRKQKNINVCRSPNKIYYYNKVVAPTISHDNSLKYKSKYYFVLNYDHTIKTISIIPLYQKGTFKGKREGRIRWKANIIDKGAYHNETNYLRLQGIVVVPCLDWDIVPSSTVTKCSSVAEESWDIL